MYLSHSIYTCEVTIYSYEDGAHIARNNFLYNNICFNNCLNNKLLRVMFIEL